MCNGEAKSNQSVHELNFIQVVLPPVSDELSTNSQDMWILHLIGPEREGKQTDRQIEKNGRQFGVLNSEVATCEMKTNDFITSLLAIDLT